MELRTITLQIVGMHCGSCAINIDFELEDIEGVKEAKTQYGKQQSVVTIEHGRVTHEQILDVIAELGYEAIITEAEQN